LAKNDYKNELPLNKALLKESAEIGLAKSLESVENRIHPMLVSSDYTSALVALAELRQPIDAFFENVMVMADDEAIKQNRLALLSRLRGLFLCCADISVLT
jgi:glycyl-tRNA synthetase beta chain